MIVVYQKKKNPKKKTKQKNPAIILIGIYRMRIMHCLAIFIYHANDNHTHTFSTPFILVVWTELSLPDLDIIRDIDIKLQFHHSVHHLCAL